MSKFYTLIYCSLFTLSLGIHTSLEAKQPPSRSQGVRLLAALPIPYREEKFQAIEQAFENRWNLFIKGKQFKAYIPNQTATNIAEEFKHIQTLREQTCFVDPKAAHLISKAEYMIAQELLEKGLFRAPRTIAFQYNCTDPTYNSSIIVLNGFRFLALEAPSAELTRNFFTLLQNYQVSQLVRLTAAQEKGKATAYPYWVGKTTRDQKTGAVSLNIPQFNNKTPYSLRYYTIENWHDQQGIAPKTLLNLILSIRKNHEPTTGLLATHCAGGVGRTGTFLAAFVLLDEIDKQIAKGIHPKNVNLSIEKIVLQLSLQRNNMVSKSAQYETLYRLVDLYLTMQTAK